MALTTSPLWRGAIPPYQFDNGKSSLQFSFTKPDRSESQSFWKRRRDAVVWFPSRASISPSEPEQDAADESDSTYMWKLAAGSVSGGAVIKYGSVILPEITSPNLLEALLMIFVPVVISILLLIKESGTKSTT